VNRRYHVQVRTATGVIGIAKSAFDSLNDALMRMDDLESELVSASTVLGASSIVVYDTADNRIITSVLLNNKEIA
jgi:hypothetical protein